MATAPWILISVGVLIVIFAILAHQAAKSKKMSTDYYGLFLGGIVWLMFGAAMQSMMFLAGGLIFILVGLSHKSEWKKNAGYTGPSAKYAIAIGFIIAFALAIYFFWLSGESLETKAKLFCGKQNVATARVCDGYIEVVSSLFGGGSTYYGSDGTTITCPVVGPDSMSPECRIIFEAKLNSSMSCIDVCANITDFESCSASGYPVIESYPRQCIANGVTYIENLSASIYTCRPEQRNVDVCADVYAPVCAKVNIQCIRAPCNPVNETFYSPCEACKNPLVESYTVGGCE